MIVDCIYKANSVLSNLEEPGSFDLRLRQKFD
jgi:hypothetical protein